MGPFTGGFLRVRAGRIPLRIHWSTPFGLFVFGGLGVSPLLWLVLASAVAVHEVGHVVLVRRFRLTIVSIDLHGLGGTCRWVGPATALQAAVIAWGGILAQLLVIAIVVGGRPFLEAGPRGATDLVLHANLYLVALNLLPFAPFDGRRAWAIFHPSNAAKVFRAFFGRAARNGPYFRP